jgi:hypothetical protein
LVEYLFNQAQNGGKGANNAGKPSGLIDWEKKPDHTYAATNEFISKFSGTFEEVHLVATLKMAVVGGVPVYKYQRGDFLDLPGCRNVEYQVYVVGPNIELKGREAINEARLAWVPGTNAFYYSPYHYRVTSDVPNSWIKLTVQESKPK